jgi:hypothetical protein
MKISTIELRNSESVLSYIYCSVVGDRGAAHSLLAPCGGSVAKELKRYAERFERELRRSYGDEAIERLRDSYRRRDEIRDAPENGTAGADDLFELAGGGTGRPKTEAWIRLACQPDDALDFLFAFNTRLEIIPELLPRLPDPEAAYEISRNIRANSSSPGEFVLLAASTAPDRLAPGYILKNREFQGYAFSIYQEDAGRYSFEFVSRQESLKGKLIHVSIVLPRVEPVIVEELCFIDTRQYALAYAGDLPRDADIRPAVIALQ